MKNTKNLILGVLSCLLLAVGFAQTYGQFGSKKDVLVSAVQMPAESLLRPIGTPGDGGPPAGLLV